MKKVYRDLQCALTDDELIKISQEAAEYSRKRSEAEEEKKFKTKELGEDIKEYDAETTRLLRLVDQGWEIRPVECQVYLDKPSKGQVSIIRSDTKETVEEREMSPEERQIPLDITNF